MGADCKSAVLTPSYQELLSGPFILPHLECDLSSLFHFRWSISPSYDNQIGEFWNRLDNQLMPTTPPNRFSTSALGRAFSYGAIPRHYFLGSRARNLYECWRQLESRIHNSPGSFRKLARWVTYWVGLRNWCNRSRKYFHNKTLWLIIAKKYKGEVSKKHTFRTK